MTAIRTSNLTKRFGTLTAVDRVDLEIETGEIFGFLGHNGAGKSTLINMLLDFARPTSGSVEVFGVDCQERPVAARERMGVLPEGYDVYDDLTGREHVRFAMESRDVTGDPMDVLERVGIADDADRDATGYSKGMKQRLVLGMALVGDPDLLILDEPTSGLDPNGAKAMREIIKAENERGATVFFSSHILEQVEKVCDRVGIMHEGELAAVDTINNLKQTVGGGTKLLITTDGDAEDCLETVQSVDGVDSAWRDAEFDGGGSDATRLVVTCTNDAKMDILVALTQAGADVLDFTTEEPSLEDLFVEYTGGKA
ncbi:ABC transporter ATP-binding protein [Halorubellus sp. PRR65]|uniref:ABC transporter ATP-binding protein n=1 Tax=Halorubellus sp. PRR65 TaxID=3098148 RepID=UPI002B260511|nr:ABC transporter ATP-binding protein [Halorubellus sp. PRR65]